MTVVYTRIQSLLTFSKRHILLIPHVLAGVVVLIWVAIVLYHLLEKRRKQHASKDTLDYLRDSSEGREDLDRTKRIIHTAFSVFRLLAVAALFVLSVVKAVKHLNDEPAVLRILSPILYVSTHHHSRLMYSTELIQLLMTILSTAVVFLPSGSWQDASSADVTILAFSDSVVQFIIYILPYARKGHTSSHHVEAGTLATIALLGLSGIIIPLAQPRSLKVR